MDHTQTRGATAPQIKVPGTATERDHEFHVATRYVPHDNSAKIAYTKNCPECRCQKYSERDDHLTPFMSELDR